MLLPSKADLEATPLVIRATFDGPPRRRLSGRCTRPRHTGLARRRRGVLACRRRDEMSTSRAPNSRIAVSIRIVAKSSGRRLHRTSGGGGRAKMVVVIVVRG